MAGLQIWVSDNPQFSHVLVLRESEIRLFRVKGMPLLRGRSVRTLIAAIEQDHDTKAVGVKLVETLDARALSRAAIAPGKVSIKLHGGEPPRTMTFLTEGIDADEVLHAILARSGRTFYPEQEDVGAFEPILPPLIPGVLLGGCCALIYDDARRMAAGQVIPVQGRHQWAQALLLRAAEALGTAGAMALAVAVILPFLGWAAARLINRPQRTVWRPQAG